MTKIWVGPTGTVIKGHVLDCAWKPLERKLKDYDNQLYLKWNPKKRGKMGVWEIRRRPNTKAVVEVAKVGNISIVKIDWAELDIENHVLDVPYLNYSVLDKVKSMDMWNYNREFFGQTVENNERDYDARIKAKAREEMIYHAKQYRTQINAFREMVLSGLNPGEIANHWNKARVE